MGLGQAAAQPGRMGMMQQSAPGYLLVDNTIYLARDTELLAINIPDGKIANRLTLPKELQITAPPMGGGPGGMGAGMGAGRAARGRIGPVFRGRA